MSDWKTIGYIGVDSGTVMVVDPCYIVPDDDWMDFCREFDDNGGYAKRYVEMNSGGIAVTTAHGDGSYAVEAKYEGNVIVELRIKFT